MFTPDTITYSDEICGRNDDLVVSNANENTILGVAMQQSNNSSDTTIECGNDAVAKNYATNYSHVPMNYQCDDNIEITKTGNDCAFVIINYVPYLTSDFTTPTGTIATYSPPTEINSAGDIELYGSFNAGEIVISFLLLCLIVLSLAKMLVTALSNIKTNKKYLSYSGGDVEIRNDL